MQRETRPPDAATRILGLVYPPAGLDHKYTQLQVTFIGRIAEAATAHGYDLLLSPGNAAGEESFQRMTDDRRVVDGVILTEIRQGDDRVDHLKKAGVPFITMGRHLVSDDMSWVDLDFTALAVGCVQHLADLGHRRIAFINRPEQLFRSGYGPSRLGSKGFVQAMEEPGFTGRTYFCDDDVPSGERCVEQILRDDPAVTSLVTMNEASLQGVYRGLIRAGRSVPRDFSVVGLVAGPWAEQVSPHLTAADVPTVEMARTAVDLMMKRLASPDSPPQHVLLKPLIALRASTGPCQVVQGEEPDLDNLEF